MAKIKFDGNQVRELLAKNTGEDIYLVKDEGAYLMNAGKGTPQGGLIVYAKGFDPKAADYDYANLRSQLGGDDFCETLKVTMIGEAVKPEAVKTLQVVVSAKSLRFEGLSR